ncbi:MAG: DUF4013 domain-containing protein [Chloroflexi bacterium]|jgi:hypothetical protein|uniref:DUF4013 domain-containing protein n=1 Tax=Candidatus Thermofonsia Clade 3 bacterium TaxID=2364212 RepID=A0A2M8Q9Y7_9CHLR|nr:DUF4013 domain-containing protein [Candidatus Roseilinea sp. NK_OTU-006]PJF46570.1 MAG: hypothetical protein CUN48_13135 [Candidatus Thermofonsia Clade 3 bacterium]RMG64888.1 MAG: DUF4013 domain-containing protein [Chloroflexota bacterium]
MIDIGRAAQHPTEDQNWLSKLGIGALIALVPILNFALSGYTIEHLKNTLNGMDVPLPAWDNLGEKLVNGLKVFVVTFVFALPIVLLTCIITVASGGLAALSGGTDQLGDAALVGVGVLTIAVSCLAALYGLFLAYLSPAIYIQYAKTKEISACLRVGELFSIARANTVDYLTIFAIFIGFAFVLGLVVGVLNIIPCLGQILSLLIAFLAAPYLAVLLGHMCGQYARNNSTIKSAV